MRTLAILTLLCSRLNFIVVVAAAAAAAATNLQDKDDIKDLTAAFLFLIDGKKFNELGKVLSDDVTYDTGIGRPVQGLPAAIAALSKIIPPETTTFNKLGTQLIKALPPLELDNKHKRRSINNRAESISYTQLKASGSGNLTGETFNLFAKFLDKEIVRTTQPGFGGWRFKNRKFEVVVSYIYLFTEHLCYATCLRNANPPFPSPSTSSLFLSRD